MSPYTVCSLNAHDEQRLKNLIRYKLTHFIFLTFLCSQVRAKVIISLGNIAGVNIDLWFAGRECETW